MIPGTVEGAFHKGFYGWLTSPLSDAEVELTERVLEHQEGPEEARARGRQATRRMRSREGRATSRAAASREPPRARGFSRAAAASQRKRLNAEARVWEELARQRESWLCPRCAFRKTLGRDGGPIINLPTRKTCFKCSYPQDGYTVLSDGSRVYVDPEAATAKELRKAGGGAVPDEGMGDPGPADPDGRLMSKGKSLRSARGLDRQARALGGDVEARSSGAREARVRESRAVRGLILGTRTGTTLSLMTARWRTSVLPTSAVVESV